MTEALHALQPRSGGRYADGTIGGGNHARAILERSSPDGWLYGCDRDATAIAGAAATLAPYNGRFELRQMNFSELATWIPRGSCDGAQLPLGIHVANSEKFICRNSKRPLYGASVAAAPAIAVASRSHP